MFAFVFCTCREGLSRGLQVQMVLWNMPTVLFEGHSWRTKLRENVWEMPLTKLQLQLLM